MFQVTTGTKRLLHLNKRIRAVCGGASASKTVSILLILIDLAQATKGKLISVASESFPHLKRGAIRDFLNIMEQHNYFKDKNWNKTDFIYQFETGSKIEFFSVDQPDKVRGPRRDVLFINEANNIPFETFTQLEIRTNETIWLDWNPVSEFWFYTQLKDKRDDIDFITLTYKDNEALSPAIVKTIESRRDNKNWFAVYGLGQLGEVEGKIYSDWKVVDEIPHEARLERYGLDFGYTNDPTAVVGIYYYNGGYILDEVLFQSGMLNNDIADNLKNITPALVIADSAEPKSIEEIRIRGINILPATKGQGSRNTGIDFVKSKRISVTKRSVNLLQEYRNYMWQTDKEGKQLNEPQEFNNHTMDAIRYGFEALRPVRQRKRILGYTQGEPTTGFGRRPIYRKSDDIFDLEWRT